MIRCLLFLFILLTSCQKVCPDKTTVTYGITDTDSIDKDNDKHQEKKTLSQSWKWGNKNCAEKE